MSEVKKWYDKHRRNLFIGLFIIFFMLIFLLNCNTIWAADDYSFYNLVWIGNKHFSFLHIFDRSLSFYLTWTGRFVSTFISYTFLYFDKSIFNLINSLIYITYIYLIYKIVKKKEETSPLMFLIIFILVWLFIPSFGQVMLWEIGSIIYLWTMTSVLFITLLFTNLLKKQDKIKDGIFVSLLLFIFSIITGNGFETNSIMLIVLTSIILFYIKFVNKQKLPLWSIASYIGIIIGGFTNFLSPGNAARMVTMGSNDSLIDRIFGGMGGFFYRGIIQSNIYLLISLVIILYIIYLISKQKNLKLYLKLNIKLLFASFITFTLMLVISSIYIGHHPFDNFLAWFYPHAKPFILFVGLLFTLFVINIVLSIIFHKNLFANTDKGVNAYIIFFTFSALVGTSAYLMTPNAWSRSYMGMCTFLIIAICYIINNLDLDLKNKIVKYTMVPIFIIIFILFLISFSSASCDMLTAKKWNIRTSNYINKEIKYNKKYILVKTYQSINEYNAASVERWLIPALIKDKEYATENGVHKYYEWINIAITNYYYKSNNAWSSGKRIIGYE